MATTPAKNKGVDLMVDAVQALVQARNGVADVKAALAKAEEVEAQAEAHVRELMALGRCDDDCPPIPEPTAAKRLPATVVPIKPAAPVTKARPSYTYTLPPTLAICWKIAFRLLDGSELDYQGTAAAIWGDDLDKTVAKNRVNAQLTRLKELGVIKTLGSNRYEVDVQKLAELSKVQITLGGVAVMA